MPLVTRSSVSGNVFKQAAEPSDWQDGDIWVDTDNGQVWVNDNGTAYQFGAGTLNQGDILYSDSDENLATLAKGTADQVLTMNAGATAPEWAAAPGLSLDGTESSSTGSGGTTAANSSNTVLFGNAFQLPTTFEWYLITAIDPNFATTGGGNIKAAALLFPSENPSANTFAVTTVATSDIVADTNGKTSMTWAIPVKGGSWVYACWYTEANGAATQYQHTTSGASSKVYNITSTRGLAGWGETLVEDDMVSSCVTGRNIDCTMYYKGITGAPDKTSWPSNPLS